MKYISNIFISIWFKYRDLFVYQFALGYNAVINLLAIIIFTRVLASEELGNFFYFIAIVNFLSIFAGFGFQQGILRFCAGKYSKKEDSIIVVYSILIILLSSFFYVIFFAISYLEIFKIEFLFLFYIYIGVIIDSIYKIILSFYQASKSVNFYRRATIISNNFKWVFGFVLVYYFNLSFYGLILSFIIGELFCIIIFVKDEVKDFNLYLSSFGLKKIKMFMKYGAPLIGYSVITFVKPLIVNYWLKLTSGESAIGIFNANFNMGLNVIGLLTTPLLLYMQPIMVEKYSKSKIDFNEKLLSFIKLFTFSGILLLSIFMIFQKSIINILVGFEYRSGGILILFGLFTAILNGLILVLIKPFEMQKRTDMIMKINLFSFSIFLILSYYLYSYFPLYGFAFSFIVSNLITVIYLIIILNDITFSLKNLIIDLLFILMLIIFSIFIQQSYNSEYSYILIRDFSILLIIIYLLVNFNFLKGIWLFQEKS